MMTLYLRRPRLSSPYHITRELYRRPVMDSFLPLDVHVDDEQYVITANIPGLSPDELSIEILDGTVTLRGEIKGEENGTGDYVIQERRLGKFERKLRLSDEIDIEGAVARVKNGVLTLRIPKAEAVRPKMIEVQAS